MFAGDLQRGIEIRLSLQTFKKAGCYLRAFAQRRIVSSFGRVARRFPVTGLCRSSDLAYINYSSQRDDKQPASTTFQKISHHSTSNFKTLEFANFLSHEVAIGRERRINRI